MTIPIRTDIITHRAFTVEHVLSAQESQAWIDEAERVGFEEATVEMPDKHVMSAQELQAWIEEAKRVGVENAKVPVPGGHVRSKDIRDNDSVTLDDPVRAAALWARLQAWCPEMIHSWRAVGLNERLRVYRYEGGQQFDWHRDGTYRQSEDLHSHLTLLIYLSEGFEGGETSFVSGQKVVPRIGMALAFEHAILHKGEPVTNGVKYVLRTDVMYAREG